MQIVVKNSSLYHTEKIKLSNTANYTLSRAIHTIANKTTFNQTHGEAISNTSHARRDRPDNKSYTHIRARKIRPSVETTLLCELAFRTQADKHRSSRQSALRALSRPTTSSSIFYLLSSLRFIYRNLRCDSSRLAAAGVDMDSRIRL